MWVVVVSVACYQIHGEVTRVKANKAKTTQASTTGQSGGQGAVEGLEGVIG